MEVKRINQAVRQCLAECYEANRPLMKVAAFVRRLESDPTWTTSEVRAVELSVLRMLALISAEPDDALEGHRVLKQPSR